MNEPEFHVEWEKVKGFIANNLTNGVYVLDEAKIKMMAYGFFLVGQRKVLTDLKISIDKKI